MRARQIHHLMVYIQPMTPRKPVKPGGHRRTPTTAYTDSGASTRLDPLITMVLSAGGQVYLDKRGLEERLLRGIEYKALTAMTAGVHELLGSLIELATTVRLADEPELPVVKGPEKLQ